jgi:hypothetical protein
MRTSLLVGLFVAVALAGPSNVKVDAKVPLPRAVPTQKPVAEKTAASAVPTKASPLHDLPQLKQEKKVVQKETPPAPTPAHAPAAPTPEQSPAPAKKDIIETMRFERMKAVSLWPEPCIPEEYVPRQYISPEFYPQRRKQRCPIDHVPVSCLTPPQVDMPQGNRAYGCWVCGRQYITPDYYAQHISTCTRRHPEAMSYYFPDWKPKRKRAKPDGTEEEVPEGEEEQPDTDGSEEPMDDYSLRERIYGKDRMMPSPPDNYIASCSQCGRTFYSPFTYTAHLPSCKPRTIIVEPPQFVTGKKYIDPWMVEHGYLSSTGSSLPPPPVEEPMVFKGEAPKKAPEKPKH